MKIKKEVIFDLETKSFFDELRTSDPGDLGVSIVSLYNRELDENLNEIEGSMHSFFEKDFERMWEFFNSADRIIGFNSIKFDVPALEPYSPGNFSKLPHFDIIQQIKDVFGKRVSLNKIAKDTLGFEKNDMGANAIKYFQKGDEKSLKLLQKYCEMDVEITKDIYDFVLKNKNLKFTDHWNTKREISLDFSYPASDDSNEQIGLF